MLLTQSNDVPGTGWYTGAPRRRSISAGDVLTYTMGTAPAVGGRPGMLAFTSVQLSFAGSFAKLGGSVPAGDHGPFKSDAVSHVSLLRRYSVFEGVSKRSQFVFTANLRSEP